VKPGFLNSIRMAKRRSFNIIVSGSLLVAQLLNSALRIPIFRI
jgi:hypothetical protein